MCILFILISFDVGEVPLLHVPYVRIRVLLSAANVLLITLRLFLPLQVIINAATLHHLGVCDAPVHGFSFVLH